MEDGNYIFERSRNCPFKKAGGGYIIASSYSRNELSKAVGIEIYISKAGNEDVPIVNDPIVVNFIDINIIEVVLDKALTRASFEAGNEHVPTIIDPMDANTIEVTLGKALIRASYPG